MAGKLVPARQVRNWQRVCLNRRWVTACRIYYGDDGLLHLTADETNERHAMPRDKRLRVAA